MNGGSEGYAEDVECEGWIWLIWRGTIAGVNFYKWPKVLLKERFGHLSNFSEEAISGD